MNLQSYDVVGLNDIDPKVCIVFQLCVCCCCCCCCCIGVCVCVFVFVFVFVCVHIPVVVVVVVIVHSNILLVGFDQNMIQLRNGQRQPLWYVRVSYVPNWFGIIMYFGAYNQLREMKRFYVQF